MTASPQTLITFIATAFSITSACSHLPVGTGGSHEPSAGSASSDPGVAPASAAGTTAAGPSTPEPDATIFTGLTEEQSTQSARTLKEELRGGLLSRIFAENELLDAVTAICGAKIWDQCQVARSSGPNELGWPEWTFKRKDAERLYRYPDMFYANAEPRWSALAVEYILRSDSGAALVKLTRDKCGTNFHDGCQVRQRHGAGYVLTVKRDGEVIHVMDTLTQWRRDL